MDTDAESSATARTTRDDDAWLWALVCYVFAYCFGTILFGFAEPTKDSLAYPALGVVGVAKLASMTNRLPYAVMSLGISVLLPIAVAAVVIIAIA